MSTKPAERKAKAYRVETPGHSLAGTLVHRLFERHSITLASEPHLITDELLRLLRDEEAADVDDLDALLLRARESYLALSGQPVLKAALAGGDALFEVPFSVRPANAQTILRGTFDCLVRQPDGRVIVLELKTGKPMPEHDEQLSMYLSAARALFPGAAVEGTLVYARGAGQDS
jgi:RecB family exonuclease